MDHSAAHPDLYIGPERAVGDLAVGLDDGGLRGKSLHQSLRPINLPRSQPENQSMNITITTMRTM